MPSSATRQRSKTPCSRLRPPDPRPRRYKCHSRCGHPPGVKHDAASARDRTHTLHAPHDSEAPSAPDHTARLHSPAVCTAMGPSLAVWPLCGEVPLRPKRRLRSATTRPLVWVAPRGSTHYAMQCNLQPNNQNVGKAELQSPKITSRTSLRFPPWTFCCARS